MPWLQGVDAIPGMVVLGLIFFLWCNQELVVDPS